MPKLRCGLPVTKFVYSVFVIRYPFFFFSVLSPSSSAFRPPFVNQIIYKILHMVLEKRPIITYLSTPEGQALLARSFFYLPIAI